MVFFNHSKSVRTLFYFYFPPIDFFITCFLKIQHSKWSISIGLVLLEAINAVLIKQRLFTGAMFIDTMIRPMDQVMKTSKNFQSNKTVWT